MNEEELKIIAREGRGELPGVGLVVSDKYIRDYGMFLNYLLVGLIDESAAAALICADSCDVESMISPSVEVIRYSDIELPFMGRGNIRALAEKAERLGVNVLHCLATSEAGLVRKLSRRMNVDYVLSVNSLQENEGGLALSAKRLAKVVCMSDSIAGRFKAVYPRFADRVGRVNFGMFTGERICCFRRLSRMVSMITATNGAEAADFEAFFKALKRMAVDGYEFMLVVISDSKSDRGIRRMLSKLGLFEQSVVIDRMKGTTALLSACDFFVEPVKQSAFNALVLEAMNLGLAVAACKGGVDDLIIEDKTAAVFKEGDEAEIYGCLRRLFDSREYARRIATEGQNYVRENHSVSQMVGQMLQIYRQVQRGA